MNESTLNALINLFAVFSIKEGKDYGIVKINLEEYLKIHLGIKNPTEYLELFFEIYDLYSSGVHILDEEKTKEIVEKICQQIKSRIHHSEQLMIFLHFLELSKRDFITAKHTLYDLVADIFEIKPNDYFSFKQFIFSEKIEDIESPGFLVINKDFKSKNQHVIHLHKSHFSGDILIYYIIETEQFIFKYIGNDALLFEGTGIHQGQFYVFNQGAIIRGNNNCNIYFTEVTATFFKFKVRNPLIFTGHHLSYTFPNSDNGIRNFSFSEPSGQFIAVMGGSGVGKSTLLNILNGNLPIKTGRILINGIDIHKEFDKIEGVMGFIPQDDLVFEELTVYQNVYFNALLCLNHVPIVEIRNHINQLLGDLSLLEVKDLVVGNPLNKVLSGGERKRLNIALELIREPSILFVDEPTSGLSSKDSEKIIVLLKQQAQQGKLVIVNIHQPSSNVYKLFDKLWIFDRGGYPVYAGNPLDAILYFKELDHHIDAENFECRVCGNVNPDQVLEIIETLKIDESGRLIQERKFPPEELHTRYLENIQNNLEFITPETNSIPATNFRKPSLLKQFSIFFLRNLKAKLSNRQYLYINLLQAPILALVVSLLTRYSSESGYYLGSNKNFPSFIFMSIIVMLFQGMSLSAEEIIKDRKILQRETFLRLSRLSYLNSKIVFLIGVSLIQSFLFLFISSWVLGMEGLFLKYWLILFLTAVSANITGLNISSGLNSVVTIYITIPLMIIPQILLCGLIVKFDDLKGKKSTNNNVPLIGELMLSRWSFEALMVEQSTENKYDIHYHDVEQEMSDHFVKGELMIPKLSNLIESISINKTFNNDGRNNPGDLKTVENVMEDLDRDGLIPAFKYYDGINSKAFNRSIGDSAIAHLDQLRAIHKSLYRESERKRDNITAQLVAKISEEELINLKKLNHNSSLATMVANQNIDNSIIEAGNHFLVKIAPIYRLPESRFGRAHFYSPYKYIGNLKIPTYDFNVLVILLTIILLYIALYLDWLKKTVLYFGNLKL